MKTKQGVSLVILSIAIIIMVLLLGFAITQINSVLEEAEKDAFVVELATIKDKVKEYYLLMGSLPVQSGVTYTPDTLKAKLANVSDQELLSNEIKTNKDQNNIFYVVNLDLLEVETEERGKGSDDTDKFLIASNTLNAYYLKGIIVENTTRFSLATLSTQNVIEDNTVPSEEVTLDTKLNVIKSTNTYTNELILTVTNELKDGESLKYSIGNATAKAVPANKVIIINLANMTSAEKTAFATNKTVTISKLTSGVVTETKEISISNLDVTNPSLGAMEMTDTANASYNMITINSADEGESGIRAIYYDYSSILVDDVETAYYSDRSVVTVDDLATFGRVSKDGTIKLEKHIKSIIAIAVDNAGNTTDITVYSIADSYVVSK